MAENNDLGGGIVDGGFVHHDNHFGKGIGSGDADAAEAQRIGVFLVNVAREGDLLGTVDAVVARIVAFGGGRIGENHATVAHQLGIGMHDVAADGIAHGAGLDMRATNVDNIEIALPRGNYTMPLLEEGFHRR